MTGDEQHKISLHADEVLLYLSEPSVTIPYLKDCIAKYWHHSVYKINVNKTMAVDINNRIPRTVKLEWVQWLSNGFKYLGIFIPLSLGKLYEANYRTLISNTSKDLERWSTLPLTLWSRIVGMNILPRLLYPFQMQPVDISKSTFEKWEKLISKFEWQKRCPRIRLTTLQLPKTGGNLRYYFWAAHLKPLIVWLQNSTQTWWLHVDRHVFPFLLVPPNDSQLAERTKVTWKSV